MPTFHLIIQGKVQGVFYRASAQKMADQLGILGWVRNTREGNVEILAQGPDEQIKRFMAWCEQGPSRARVEKLVSAPAEQQEFHEFKIVH